MGALSDLLQRLPQAANPANPANQQPAKAYESQESQESHGGTFEMRAHLLHLADAGTLPASIVHRLHADDVGGCAGLPDETLLAYLRAQDRGTVMDAGIAPESYTQAAHCDGCGPVWLWPGAPDRLIACPWCFRRKAGKSLPRPQVTCRDCRHHSPDPLNVEAGIGHCGLGAARARWPMQGHYCADHKPSELRS